MKTPTAIVIGASSGIGREIVVQLCLSGYIVAAVARRKDRLDQLVNQYPKQVLAYVHDVTDYSDAPQLFMQMTQDLGGLDVFVYNSGAMPIIGANEYSFEKDQQMVEVNISGAIAWCNLAAERFGNVGHGTLIGIGSVAGDRGRHLQPVYNASKAFFHTYLESLRNRISSTGAKVVTIKPGPVDTEMTTHLKMKKMSAADAARVIVSKVGKNGEFYLSAVHRIAFYIIKRIPSPIFRKLKI
jgi:NADP-dependent 3-hydroxy acid dehydrogenase YdfG